MKKILIPAFCLALSALFASCGEKNEENKGPIDFQNSGLTDQVIYANETPQSVAFTAAADWTASVKDNEATRASSWLSLDKSEGAAGENTLGISANHNYTGVDRSARITLTCQGIPQYIDIEQKATLRDGSPAVNPFRTIKSAADLKEFAADLRRMGYESDEDALRKKWGRTVVLENDIDLGGEKMEAIMAPYNGGTMPVDFDGGGHTISGINMTNTTYGAAYKSAAGLFGTISYGQKLYNLHVEGNVLNENDNGAAGGIAGGCSGLIEGCSFKGTVKGDVYAGGIAATASFDKGIRSCWVKEGTTVEATYKKGYGSPQYGSAGGIVGFTNASIVSCYSLASEVKGARFSGGVVGSFYSSNPDQIMYMASLYSLKTDKTPSQVIASITGNDKKVVQDTETFENAAGFWSSGYVNKMNEFTASGKYSSAYYFVRDDATGYAKTEKR